MGQVMPVGGPAWVPDHWPSWQERSRLESVRCTSCGALGADLLTREASRRRGR